MPLPDYVHVPGRQLENKLYHSGSAEYCTLDVPLSCARDLRLETFSMHDRSHNLKIDSGRLRV